MKNPAPVNSAPYGVSSLGLANIALALVILLTGTGGLKYLVLKATVGQPLPAGLIPYYAHIDLVMLVLPTVLVYGLLRAIGAGSWLRTYPANHALLAAGSAAIALPMLARSFLWAVVPTSLWTAYTHLLYYTKQMAEYSTPVLAVALGVTVFRSARTADATIHGAEPSVRRAQAGLFAMGAAYIGFTLWKVADDRGRSLVDLALASPPWLVKAMAVMLVLAAASYALAVAAKEARAWVALAAFATAAYFAHTWKIPTLVLALVSLIVYVRLGRKAL